ncbi:hypothetical protein N9I71_01465 [Amylibacter sp.]|nr:hypothetical protein [Amylibacter sp.]MDB4079933.1 hypothetical protein [Amylibacter sp.]
MDSISSAGDKDDYSQMNQSVYTVMSYNSGFAAHPLGLPSDCGSRYMASFAALDMAVLKSYYGANNSYNDGSNTYTLSSKDNFKAIWDSDGSDEIIMGKNSNAVIAPRAATLEYEAGGAGFFSIMPIPKVDIQLQMVWRLKMQKVAVEIIQSLAMMVVITLFVF